MTLSPWHWDKDGKIFDFSANFDGKKFSKKKKNQLCLIIKNFHLKQIKIILYFLLLHF